MEIITTGNLCRNAQRYLEIHQKICDNIISAISALVMQKDLSDGAPTPFEDRSFYFFLDDKYRTSILNCQYIIQIFVWNIRLELCGEFENNAH